MINLKIKKIGAWSILLTMTTGLSGIAYNGATSFASQVRSNKERLIVLEERERAAKEILIENVIPQLKAMNESLHFIKGRMSK